MLTLQTARCGFAMRSGEPCVAVAGHVHPGRDAVAMVAAGSSIGAKWSLALRARPSISAIALAIPTYAVQAMRGVAIDRRDARVLFRGTRHELEKQQQLQPHSHLWYSLALITSKRFSPPAFFRPLHRRQGNNGRADCN